MNPVIAAAYAQMNAETGGDPRLEELWLWGVHCVRRERCECCGAPLALLEEQDRRQSPEHTTTRWVELVRDSPRGIVGMLYEVHDTARCRALRAR